MRCFLFGHSDTSADVLPMLHHEIKRHITEYDVTEFVVGRYGNFDYFARLAVNELKSFYPSVRLTMLLPYYPPTLPLPPECDETLFPEGLESVPRRFSIVQANRYMLNHCDFVICYVRVRASSSGKLLRQALIRERQGRLSLTNLHKNIANF